MANMPEARDYRDEAFSIYSYGFRNPRDLAERGHIDALVIGDSFAGGSGVSDAQTLSARLMARTGRRVYNAGGKTVGLDDILAIAKRLRMERGLVLYVQLERADLPAPGSMQGRIFSDVEASKPEPALVRANRLWQDLKISRLQILVSRLERAFHLQQPSPWAIVRHFEDGTPILFFHGEMNVTQQRSVDVRYFRWLADQLHAHELDLLVLLVPNKITIYMPHLRERQPLPQPPYLDRVAAALDEVKVPMINLRPRFQEEADAGLPRGDLLYWNDDTHWNPRGIDLAARLIAERWR
jgi:hypothetical protein